MKMEEKYISLAERFFIPTERSVFQQAPSGAVLVTGGASVAHAFADPDMKVHSFNKKLRLPKNFSDEDKISLVKETMTRWQRFIHGGNEGFSYKVPSTCGSCVNAQDVLTKIFNDCSTYNEFPFVYNNASRTYSTTYGDLDEFLKSGEEGLMRKVIRDIEKESKLYIQEGEIAIPFLDSLGVKGYERDFKAMKERFENYERNFRKGLFNGEHFGLYHDREQISKVKWGLKRQVEDWARRKDKKSPFAEE